MRSKLKVFILVVVFVVPVALFVFLKMFGSNTFDVAIIEEQVECTEVLAKAPSTQLSLINYQYQSGEDSLEAVNQFRRVVQRFKNRGAVGMYLHSGDSSYMEMTAKYPVVTFISDSSLLKCMNRFANNSNKFLLFDKQNNLRGIYDIARGEVDRLFMEVDILLIGKEENTTR